MSDPLDLTAREGLPDALRVLLQDYPRAAWSRDPNFHGLVSFWLDRHLMFRRLVGAMTDDARAFLDRGMEARAYAGRLARLGQTFVAELHGHHGIEDAHYFPVLARAEPRIERGFALLEADHKALDPELAAFAGAANAVLGAVAAGAPAADHGAAFLTRLAAMERLLDRHLTDEEELVVPVILRHGQRGLG
jgi:hypothetical protein